MSLRFCGVICLEPTLYRIDAHSDCALKKKKVFKGPSRDGVKIHSSKDWAAAGHHSKASHSSTQDRKYPMLHLVLQRELSNHLQEQQ